MNRIKFVLIAVFALTGSLVVSQSENAAAHNKMQAIYNQFCKFAEAKNVEGMWKFVDKSCVMVEADGSKMGAAAAKKEMVDIFKVMKDIKCRVKVDHVSVDGPEVCAWVTMSVSSKFKEGNKWVPFSFTAKYAETWRNFGGNWKVVYAQALP